MEPKMNAPYWIMDVEGIEKPLGPVEKYDEALLIKAKYEVNYNSRYFIIDNEIKKLIQIDCCF